MISGHLPVGDLVREAMVGSRSALRALPVMLPMAVAFASWPSGPSVREMAQALALAVASGLYSVGNIWANDRADLEEDAAAQKRRPIAALPKCWAWSLILGTLFVGFGTLRLCGFPNLSLALFIAAWALGIGYSWPPLRFKNRGILGPMTYALSTLFAFVLVPTVTFRAPPGQCGFLGLALFLDKWVQLHFHQLVDEEADRKVGVHTIVPVLGHERAARWLKHIAHATAAACAIALVWIAANLGQYAVIFAIAWISAVGSVLAFKWAAQVFLGASDLTQRLPSSYLALSWTLFYAAPIALWVLVVLRQPAAVVLLLINATGCLLETWRMARYRYT